MISSVLIRNFRSVRDLSFTLEPLTVLVGPNGAGKTTLLHALNPSATFDPVKDSWRHQQGKMEILLTGPAVKLHRGFAGLPLGSFDCQNLHLDLKRMRQPVSLELIRRLQADGAQLTNVFDSLSRRQREQVAEAFCRLVPTFRDVDRIAAQQTGTHELRFQDRWDPQVWYAPSEVSDGSILALAFLLLQYQQPAPRIVTIEEPEHGLHPYLIEQVIDLLRKLASGELGTAIQVVVATHSPQVLEFVRPEEVRFVDRDPQTGEVKVTAPPTAEPDWKATLEKYGESLGSMWLSGGLGGVPA